ncbi:hypothetical protein BU25DRAFT_27144 [Macroventuria anomochaeta]|uniref:Uncharacterized protein n=1 Tax=Macroventuria anomochaeta TaxID=301207 RepID=A0ACB6S7L0_9PLEO|nr:uncharacterized protein BU25DRAFT_27144 [Macroventuria anomochaeta]KAF2629122.1 hypothetical protein BU25DRAFT_27144 [Macroventuria anomochaeta]
MDRIPSDGIGWVKCHEESRARLLEQLKDLIQEMRRITPSKGTSVANVNGGSLYDPRLMDLFIFGPLEAFMEFHRYLRGSSRFQELRSDPTPS